MNQNRTIRNSVFLRLHHHTPIHYRPSMRKAKLELGCKRSPIAVVPNRCMPNTVPVVGIGILYEGCVTGPHQFYTVLWGSYHTCWQEWYTKFFVGTPYVSASRNPFCIGFTALFCPMYTLVVSDRPARCATTCGTKRNTNLQLIYLPIHARCKE